MAQTRSAGRAPGGGRARPPRHGARYPSRPSHASLASTDSDESELSSPGSSIEVVMLSSDSDSTPSNDASRSSRPRRPVPPPRSKRQSPRSTVGRAPHRPPANGSAHPRRAIAPSGDTSGRHTKDTASPSRGRVSSVSSVSPAKQRHKQKHKELDATLHGHSAEPERRIPIVPNWLDPRMPYECWVNIFLYAGCESGPDCPTTGWLVGAATTCRALAEPALTAIYRCPVIRTPTKARRLAALLKRDPSDTLFNYRAKIESLHIDIHIVPQPILYQLIHPLFRLKELVIFTTTDQPPYRKLETNLRWHYSEDIFRALLAGPAGPPGAAAEKPFPTVLKSWEWSGRLIGGHVATVDDIARIHRMPSFAHLTRVSFTNFQVPSLRELAPTASDEVSEHEDGLVIEAVARAICELKSLKHLVFESSTVMNDRLLSLLPHDLHHLELINCWVVKSEHLAAFLRTRGSQLRTLSLLHNQSLNLEFLTDLADTCPNLRVLHMNMSYYRHHITAFTSDPLYDYALLPSQVPNWPSTLRVLNIENIRDWHEETAEMFLQSISASSAKLTDLRHLFIKTMLDIPWQARAELRNKWRLEMERIYRRPVIPPLERTSIRGADEMEGGDPGEPSRPKRKRLPASHPPSPSRRSSRIADFQIQKDVGSRRARGGRPVYREPDTDEDEFDVTTEDEESEDEDASRQKRGKDAETATDAAGPTIQGLCDTVNILFDNQKPTELQFGMDDFLDAEGSDREWNGDDDDDDDDGGAIAF